MPVGSESVWATAGSVWQAAVFGFGGLCLTDQGLAATPRLPAHWQRLRFKLFDHGEQRAAVDVGARSVMRYNHACAPSYGPTITRMA